MRYVKHITNRKTPQSAPIPGETQVRNNAGGYVYQLDNWARLRRFLILGSEGNTYYTTERELTKENAGVVLESIQEDGTRTVSEIVEVSFAGRAPKNDPAVFALAMCTAFGDDETKRAAVEALPKVCRIGTHLFHFADAAGELRGWGKMLRSAVGEWYGSKSAKELALQVVKYKQRDGWSHRDLLRLGHVRPKDEMQNSIFKWVTKEDVPVEPFRDTEAEIIWAADEAQKAEKPRLIELIERYNLPREVIPTGRMSDPDIWAAMLPSMGMTALIRNLANMTRSGLIGPGGGEAVKTIVARITDDDQLKRARVHPIQVLSAMMTYSSGRGVRSKGAGWTPNQKLVDALDSAFYKTFKFVEPTDKRYMLALDVSGSMTGGVVAGVPGLSPRVASAALAMVTQAVEDDVQTVAFSTGDGCFSMKTGHPWEAHGYMTGLDPVNLSKRRRLDDVVKQVSGMPFGGTDCALPMLYASAKQIMVDVFVIYTDSETWAGNIHPVQALRDYRAKFNPDAKLIVVGLVSNGFSIADPKDPGMLDVVGFDTAAPAVMADFARGKV